MHRRARALIADRGLRYDKVAERLGITPDRLNHILAGRRPVLEPAEDFYARLADALFCEPIDLRESEEEAVAAA